MARILYALLTTMMIAILTHTAHASEMTGTSCRMLSEGIYNGAWVKHRIVADEDVVAGANDMESLLNQLEDLRTQGLCR